MSKESVRARIETLKGDIARYRTQLASLRSLKSETNARYSALIKNAASTSSKASYRNQKASVIANIESQIRTINSSIATKQRFLAEMRARLKTEK